MSEPQRIASGGEPWSLVSLLIEQRQRWQQGERPPVEAYLERFPSLADHVEAVLDLIGNELLLRHEWGDEPLPEEYRRRFPQWAEQLQVQLEVERALDRETLLQTAQGQARAVALARSADVGGDAALPAIPGYEILEEIGRGGQSVVFKARQLALERLVALKLILAGPAVGPDERARFGREAEAVAHLEHPHIVRIYEVGEQAGQPYLALEYAAGGSLAQKLGGAPQPPRRAAEVTETLARTMHWAHQRGIVHRDLKPGNVLVTADGLLKITDFGLAKRLEAAGDLTHTGYILGTPSYMAPEQAAGKNKEVGPAADVYALGAILYELLTGRPPFMGETPWDILAQVLQADPVPPVRLQPKVPRDLETICLKCLHKEPHRRYGSALELAEDLGRYLAGKPVKARPVGRLEQLRKWARRRPALAALWTVSLAVVLGGGALWLGLVQAEAQRQVNAARAEMQRTAEATRRQAETVRGVEQSLAEARVLRRQASREQFRDLAGWSAALAAARRAEALLERGEGTPELQRRVAKLLAELKAEERDRRMVQRLEEEARLRQAELLTLEVNDATAANAFAAADAAYAASFRWYEIDVDRLAASEAAARIGRASIAMHLVGALDHWAGLRKRGKGRAQLLKVARRADADPWRNRLREALAQENFKALRALAAQSKVSSLRVDVVIQLGHVLAAVGDFPGAVHILEQAQRQQPEDFWINFDLAYCLGNLKPPQWEEALRFWTAALSLRSQNPVVWNNLGIALYQKGRQDEAITAFQRAIRLEKDYALAHSNLGNALHHKGRLDEAIGAYREAIRLEKDSAGAHSNLGNALRDKGRLDEAIAACQEAIRLEKDFAGAHNNLGLALRDKGRLDEAIAAFKDAIRLEKNFARAHYNLGLALSDKGRLDEAIAAFKDAIRLKKNFPEAYTDLGKVLRHKGRVGEAIAACQEAIRLEKVSPEAHYYLGAALYDKGRLDEAIAAYREAIRLKKDFPDAYINLGNVLLARGRLDEAIAAGKEAIRLKKDYAEAHTSLGIALLGRGRLDEAIAAHQQAIRLNKDYARAYSNLGLALLARGRLDEAIAAGKQAIQLKKGSPHPYVVLGLALQLKGQFAEALTALEHGHQLGRRDPRFPQQQLAQLVKVCQRLVQLEARLPALLRGEAKPADVAEQLELVNVCKLKRLYGAAARFSQEAFTAQPQLVADPQNGHRYKAACYAALASRSEGQEANKLDAQQRGRWRLQALVWLRADLELWAGRVQGNTPQTLALVRKTMLHWRQDPDLAGVRDTVALAKLPRAERAAWNKFWADGEVLLKRVSEAK